MTSAKPRLLLFGCSGAIGMAIADYFRADGWDVLGVSRRPSTNLSLMTWNPLDPGDSGGMHAVQSAGPYDAVCWAQGANCNDSLYAFEPVRHQAMYEANVLYILSSLHALLASQALARPARLCVISSIWQNMARQEKLSYCVTKSALQGLVLSAANDLGRDGHLINAVLPGVIDTPMTRANLRPEQVEKIIDGTQFRRLPTLEDVAAAVHALCSPRNTGVTGQFVTVDLGYSHARFI